MKPVIFDAATLSEKVPQGFNSVKMMLNGRLKSDLKWKDAEAGALSYIDNGLKIFWEIDLGILAGLRSPLTNQSQFLSLRLSLEHFRDTLLRKHHEHTVGFSLYRGKGDFLQNYLWDDAEEQNLKGWLEEQFAGIDCFNKEVGLSAFDFSSLHYRSIQETVQGRAILQLYCRDAVAEYLDLLAKGLTGGTSAYIMLDTEEIEDEVHVANLLNKDRFPHLTLALKEERLPPQEVSWENGVSSKGYFGRALPKTEVAATPQVAVCLPSFTLMKPSDYRVLRGIFKELSARFLPYKIIPEALITAEWDQLDFIVVDGTLVSYQGKRMLMGFVAAGGTVVNLGAPLGLSCEIGKEEFLEITERNLSHKRPISYPESGFSAYAD